MNVFPSTGFSAFRKEELYVLNLCGHIIKIRYFHIKISKVIHVYNLIPLYKWWLSGVVFQCALYFLCVFL